MNFDFGKHWDTRIVPLLALPEIKKSIKKGVDQHLKKYNPQKKYNRKEAPASQMQRSCDFYAEAYMNYETYMRNLLVKEGRLKNIPEENYLEFEEYYFGAQVTGILKPYMDHFERTNIAAYQCFSACFFWNTTFGITLARIVDPNERWRVLMSDWHATVVNHDRTKVFDIMDYKKGGSRGGKSAIHEATRTDSRAPE